MWLLLHQPVNDQGVEPVALVPRSFQLTSISCGVRVIEKNGRL